MKAMSIGHFDKAAGMLGECIALHPNHFSGRFNYALTLALQDNCDEAVEQFEILAERDPEYPGVYTAMGQAAMGSYLKHMGQARERRRSMIDLLRTAVEMDPEDVDALFSLGNAYMATGNASKALPWLKNALLIQPDSAAIYFSIAKAFVNLKKIHEASTMAKKAMELSSPKDPFWDDIRGLASELQQTGFSF
jgi:cytochrome c-type biogenesis protein CcmH/NrfG